MKKAPPVYTRSVRSVGAPSEQITRPPQTTQAPRRADSQAPHAEPASPSMIYRTCVKRITLTGAWSATTHYGVQQTHLQTTRAREHTKGEGYASDATSRPGRKGPPSRVTRSSTPSMCAASKGTCAPGKPDSHDSKEHVESYLVHSQARDK